MVTELVLAVITPGGRSVNVYRACWSTVAGVLMAIGLALALATLGPAEVLAVAIPLAGSPACTPISTPPRTAAAPAHICSWAVRFGVGVPAVIGLMASLGPASLDPVRRRSSPPRRPWSSGCGTGTPSPATRGRPGPSVAARISDHDLALAWQSSYVACQTTTDVATKTRIVQMRTVLLDELERRSMPSWRTRRWVASPDQLYEARTRP